MRGLAWFVAVCAMMSFVPAAKAATILSTCTAGCTTNASGNLQVDYTVPTNGQAFRWDLWTLSNPTAQITLAAPNDTFSVENTSNGDGTTATSFPLPNLTWNEIVGAGHTIIMLWAPADFNDCASKPSAGTVCSLSSTIEGDSSLLHVSIPGLTSPGVVTVSFTATSVPEPAVWSLMIGGFFALGWTLRRHRAAQHRA